MRIQNMKKFLLVGLTVIALMAAVVAVDTAPALASAKDEICAGVGAASGGGGCTTTSGPTVNSVINTVVNILSLVVGIIAVIMVVFAGFRYVTSGGDSGKVSSAKNTLIYAIVGIVVAAVARPLVQFILNKVL
jgi:hypothetical protein